MSADRQIPIYRAVTQQEMNIETPTGDREQEIIKRFSAFFTGDLHHQWDLREAKIPER